MIGSPDRARTPAGCGLPARVAEGLEAAGLDVAGVLDAARYDERVPPAWHVARVGPGARSVVVLGSGGRRLAEVLGEARLASGDPHPVDGFTRECVQAAADALGAAGHPTTALHYWDVRAAAPGEAPVPADFVALARAAGLGVPGRLRLLIHPRFGPWLAIRALLVTQLPLPATPPLEGFDPCTGCPAPCARACPGAALDAGLLDLDRCLQTRERVAGCETACAARRACVIGEAHAYPAWLEAHFARSSLRASRETKGNASPEA